MKNKSILILCTILLMIMSISPVIAKDSAGDTPKYTGNSSIADLNQDSIQDEPVGNLILPIKEATEIETVSQSVIIGDNQFGPNTQASDKISVTPAQTEFSREQSTITHSVSQSIVSGNSIACNNSINTFETHYLRTFTLQDFGILDDFNVTQVEFGIETLNIPADITVNLYTLDGTFIYTNLTQIGTTTVDLDPQALTVVSVPISGTAPAGSTLVVEVVSLDLTGEFGAFFIGSNAEGQTAPSYVVATVCGISEPTATASVGYPNVHIVMNVTGETQGAFKVFLPLVIKPYMIPATPVLNGINNGGNSSYTVSWSASDGATAYLLQEDDNGAFTSPSTAYDAGDTSVPLNKGLGTYYYRVKAYNPAYSSGWSNVVSVIVTDETPAVGSWSGTISGGNTITMDIISNGTMIERIVLNVNWSGSCGINSVTFYFYDVPISDGHFYRSTGSGGPNVGGDFTSTTTANGTYYAIASTGTCTVSRSGTWTATYSP
ncbi:MAG: hypothetical protein MUO40_11585 [Anaerolineaceae bacterium]|nr:hypothetical protein [Anaerolineaceae bacterium]